MKRIEPWFPFPAWMLNACVIGYNADNEQLAVAMNENGYQDGPYLFRLNNRNCWITVRAALLDDVKKFDAIFLGEMLVSMVDLPPDPPKGK